MENQNSVCFVARINEIKEIPNADNIEQAIIGGWSCITKKGAHKVNDMVVVATTDAVIPLNLSDNLGVTNYLRKGQRVRTVKLRGVYSECLLIPFEYANISSKKIVTEGSDCMDILGIIKYEPPVKTISLGGGRKIKYKDNPNFKVYYKFPNAKNVNGMFTEEDVVEISRKLHGTNARYGIIKKTKLSFIDKVKKFFRLADKWIDYEFVYGSHAVEKGSDTQGFYSTDVWRTIDEKYSIKEKLWDEVKNGITSHVSIGNGLIIYGEIYGAGIQKGYDYGLEDIRFAGFDTIIRDKYDSPTGTFATIFHSLELPYVEVLYFGKWSQEIQDKYTFNNFIEGTKTPHEGIVIKHVSGDRNKVYKCINPDYLIYAEKHNVEDSH
jgi:RNA ligase (TIGR02306 family)